jgi:hypothetical protein
VQGDDVSGELVPGPLEIVAGDTQQEQHPDFVMVGLQDAHNGVLLFASTTLSHAGLKRKVVGYLTDPKRPRTRIPVEEATVTAVMRDFTLIHADSYQQALADLMADWERKARTQQKAVEQ